MNKLIPISSITNSIISVIKKPKLLSLVLQNIQNVLSLLQPIIIFLSPIITVISKLKIIFTPFVWIFTVYSISEYISNIALLLFSIKDYLLHYNDKAAKCNLCNQITFNILDTENINPNDINCDQSCPFGLKQCKDMCKKISKAIFSVSEYPCEALKMCTKSTLIDSNIDPIISSCEHVSRYNLFGIKSLICEPSSLCYKHIGKFEELLKNIHFNNINTT